MGTPAAVETAWLQSVADRYDWPNAIMARGILADPSAPKELATHTPYKNFRGISDCCELNLVCTPQWNVVYKALLELRGFCELIITHEYFKAAYQVSKHFPDQPQILSYVRVPVVSD